MEHVWVHLIWFFAGVGYLLGGIFLLMWADDRWEASVSRLVGESSVKCFGCMILWPVALPLGLAGYLRSERRFMRSTYRAWWQF